MVPNSRRLRPRILLALAAVSVSLWAVAFAQAEDQAATVDVLVSGQGVPVAGVKVTLAPDNGGTPENWSVAVSKPLGELTTDATGHAVFPNVPPAKYFVTTGCLAPGNWISGSYATRVETLPGHASSITLTLRKGAMIRGKALQGTAPAGHAVVTANSADGLLTPCPMLNSSNVDSTTGGFTVSKVPVNATIALKAEMPMGEGDLGVWREFHVDKPETLDVAFQFPAFEARDLGSIVVDLTADGTAKPDSGVAMLMQTKDDNSWRYTANASVGGTMGPTKITGLPAGHYQIRSNAMPGSSKWWTAAIDTLNILPGKTATYTIKVKLSQ